MEYIAFSAGVFMKIVDEIDDVNLLDLKEYKQYFYTLFTLFISLWMYNDPYISISCIFAVVACYYVKAIDNIYWKSLIPIPFITLLLKVYELENINMDMILPNLLYMAFIFLFCVYEANLFPEEISNYKIIFRIFIIFLIPFIIYLTDEYISGLIIKPWLLFALGYCIISVISKTLFSEIPKPLESLPLESLKPKGELDTP